MNFIAFHVLNKRLPGWNLLTAMRLFNAPFCAFMYAERISPENAAEFAEIERQLG